MSPGIMARPRKPAQAQQQQQQQQPNEAGDAAPPAERAAKPTKEEREAQRAAEEAAAEAQSPVASAVAKRLRACRKKLRKIEETEERAASGKELDEAQRALIAGKPGLLAVIEELDKLTSLMKEAAAEEAKLHRQAGFEAASAEWQRKEERRQRREAEAKEREAAQAEGQARARQEEAAQAKADKAIEAKPAAEEAGAKPDPMQHVRPLVQLLYFSQVRAAGAAGLAGRE
jgi:hypothetical protein